MVSSKIKQTNRQNPLNSKLYRFNVHLLEIENVFQSFRALKVKIRVIVFYYEWVK